MATRKKKFSQASTSSTQGVVDRNRRNSGIANFIAMDFTEDDLKRIDGYYRRLGGAPNYPEETLDLIGRHEGR